MAVLCALFVVIIHCRPEFPVNTFGWWVRQLLEHGITQIAVPFYFTVSGFVLVGHVEFQREGGCFCTFEWYRRELSKRVRTLLVPFAIWNVLWILMFLPLCRIQEANGELGWCRFPTLAEFGLWPCGCPALVPLWYIRAVFVLVLFSPLLIAALRRWGWCALVVLYAVYGVCCPYAPMSWWTVVQSLTRCGILPVQGFFYFSIGMALRLGIVQDNARRVPTWLLVAVGMGFVVARAWFDATPWSCYLGFLSLPFLLYGIWRMVPEKPWPTWLIVSSFPIYVLHRFVQYNLLIAMGPVDSILGYFMMTVVPLAVSICVGMALRMCLPRFTSMAFGGR